MRQYNYNQEEGNTKYIHDRWLNKEYEFIALQCKGRWIIYRKEGAL